jgi:hypothetical protein
VELVVWAALAIAVVAILGRFVLRSGNGDVVLPRVVDESIGMWLLRKVTGRRLWERQPDEAQDDAGAGVAVMAAPATNPTAPGFTEQPIRILALPPATLPLATATPPVIPLASIDHLDRRARPAVLPTRYSASLARPADAAPATPVGTSR